MKQTGSKRFFWRHQAARDRDHAEAEAQRKGGARQRLCREPRPRPSPAADVRDVLRTHDAERSGRDPPSCRAPRPAACCSPSNAAAMSLPTASSSPLTPHVLTLAASYLRSSQIATVLQPVLDRVATDAREICSLAVLDRHEAVFIARSSPTRVFSAGIDIGYRLPAFCTSVGRAMLGQFGDDELAAMIPAMPREAMTPQTVTDPKLILAAIIRDRETRLFPCRPRGRAAFPFDLCPGAAL